MSSRAARYIEFLDRDGSPTTDPYVETITQVGAVRTFHKDSPDGEWQRYPATGGLIAPEGGPYGPRLDSISPATAEMGAAAFTMSCIGAVFTTSSQVLFNGGAETTTYVSETELTIEVDPTTASGPWTIPVWVEDHDLVTAQQDFTFTEPAG